MLARLLTRQGLAAQLLRYGVVGLLVTTVDFGVFLGLTALEPTLYAPANILAKLASGATGFVLHKRVTFAGQQRHGTRQQALRYVLLLLGNTALSTLLVALGVAGLHWPDLPVKAATEVIVVAVAFSISRWFVYTPASRAAVSADVLESRLE